MNASRNRPGWLASLYNVNSRPRYRGRSVVNRLRMWAIRRMRIAIVFPLIALLLGCDRTTLQTVETVVAPNGTDRLIRKSWETVSLSNPNEKSYDSHSLVWQRLKNGSWIDRVTITQEDFQRGHALGRLKNKFPDSVASYRISMAV